MIATVRPVDLGIVGTTLTEEDLVDVLASRFAALDPAAWTVAGCSFTVAD